MTTTCVSCQGPLRLRAFVHDAVSIHRVLTHLNLPLGYAPAVRTRDYDALVLDMDGTLLDDTGRVPDATARELSRIAKVGVRIMLATGRSALGVRDVALSLGLTVPAIVYNGAGVYDPIEDRMLTCATVPQATVAHLLRSADQMDALAVVSRVDAQYTRGPRTAEERLVLRDYRNLRSVAQSEVPTRDVLRVTLLSELHNDSEGLLAEVRHELDGLDARAHLTHFRLNQLAHFRDSHMQVVDVQPPCKGKAEALDLLLDRHSIAATRVVAVGDADNDLEMLRAAGLGVAMGNATAAAIEAADRQIGPNTGPALAELIAELF